MGNSSSAKANKAKSGDLVPEDAMAQYDRDMAAAGKPLSNIGSKKHHHGGKRHGKGESKDRYENVGEYSGKSKAYEAPKPRMDPALQGFADSLKNKRKTGGRKKKRIIVGDVAQLPGTLRQTTRDSPGSQSTGSPRQKSSEQHNVAASQPGATFLSPHRR